MGGWLRWGALAVAVSIAAAGIAIYWQVASIEAERVTEDVHVLFGAGGNVGVLRTERGSVIVDTLTFRMQGEKIRQRAEELTGGPVQAVINTHYHGDHTHGNPAFPPGTRIVSTDRTRAHMLAFDGDFWSGAAAETLPSETFESDHEISVGGKTVRSLHPGRGHTDGDLVVLFVEDRVVHLGDLLFYRRYPNIDLEAGGSIEAWIGTLDRVLELDFDRVIPGHGPVTDRAGVEEFQGFLRELWSVGARAAREGWSLERTLATDELRADEGYEAMVIPGILSLDREFVLRRAWEEATGAVEPRGEEGT